MHINTMRTQLYFNRIILGRCSDLQTYMHHISIIVIANIIQVLTTMESKLVKYHMRKVEMVNKAVRHSF